MNNPNDNIIYNHKDFFSLNLAQFGQVYFIKHDEEYNKKIMLEFFFNTVFPKYDITPTDAYSFILTNVFKDFVQVPNFRNLSLNELNEIQNWVIFNVKMSKDKLSFIQSTRDQYNLTDTDLSDDSITQLYDYLKTFKI